MGTGSNNSSPSNRRDNSSGSNFFKSILFFNSNSKRLSDDDSPRPIPLLSPIANSVVSRCSKILSIPTEELQHCFETEQPDAVKQPSTYARNFLEFCSYKALHLVTEHTDYLSDKEFRRLTYDMMLAWEAPGFDNEPLDTETASCSNHEVEGEDGWSLFYSSSTKMAVEVDKKKTVGPEAFSRIAPACAVVADIITVDNLFDALTSSSCNRLHFLIYDKYLRMLEKVIKAVKSSLGPQSPSRLELSEGEFILDIDGTVPIQPVLKHIGMSAWPGRLMLTNYALHFEPLGVGLNEKAVRYDLAMDMRQIIRAELTGPLGARVFDKAVMYKSICVTEPVYLEFPEFKGNSRRDYWLDISLEILQAHRFIRKYNLKGSQQSEALARAVLGILRYRAVKEAFHLSLSHYKTLLCYNLAESLPGGDAILETLSSHLALLNASPSEHDSVGPLNSKQGLKLPVSLLALCRLGIMSENGAHINEEAVDVALDVRVGEVNPLEMAVKQAKQKAGRVEAAQATVDQVKVEGIDSNIAVMKELLFPVIESFNCLQVLASWKDPWRSTAFVVMISYTIFRGWIKYVLASIFVILAVLMLWHGHAKKGRQLNALKISAPPQKNAVEQLLTLQDTITHVESLIQDGNIILLKVRALLFAALPQATDGVALLLVLVAVLTAVIPLKYLILLVFLEAFTREMPLRKASSDRWLRRIREWWVRIPAAPVLLIRAEDKKRK
ncbi:uncharacterized protein LOC127809805 [Diospyros lotus]|uniref:uncharacterized protein LOC127809805 n=1 Tax=Diospyros lotus TaxID=55363 RepID=UPI002250F996|nr:uncharacterized protein LOC127809805 [Diospyros lotus]